MAILVNLIISYSKADYVSHSEHLLKTLDSDSYHKRQITNPPTPLPPMFKIAKFQIRHRRYQPNLTFDFGGYDYWRLWILTGTALAVLKFGVCPGIAL